MDEREKKKKSLHLRLALWHRSEAPHPGPLSLLSLSLGTADGCPLSITSHTCAGLLPSPPEAKAVRRCHPTMSLPEELICCGGGDRVAHQEVSAVRSARNEVLGNNNGALILRACFPFH